MPPANETTFGRELKRMRDCVLVREHVSGATDQVPLTHDLLWEALGFRGTSTSISRWENDREKPNRAQLLKLVKFFAGRPGCLETPQAAQAWVILIDVPLSKGELEYAFDPEDKDAEERGFGDPAKQVALKRITAESIREAATPPLTPSERREYLYDLVWKAYSQPPGGRVQQGAEELLDPSRPAPRGRFPAPVAQAPRDFIHAYEQMGLLKRERLPADRTLLTWFLGRDERGLALLAGPGCGKTTALYEMAAEAAAAVLKVGNGPLPVLVSLRNYSAARGSLADWLPRGARESLASRLEECNYDKQDIPKILEAFEPVAGRLEELRKKGELLLLIDGLNELPGGADGPLRDQVDAFVAAALQDPPNRVVVACRVADYRDAIRSLLMRVELLPFDDAQIYEALTGHLTQEGHEQEARAIIGELARPEHTRLREILQVPLYVWAFSNASLDWDDKEKTYRLPTNRGQLLDACVEDLLAREYKKTPGDLPRIAPSELHRALAQVAYELRKNHDSHGTAHAASVVCSCFGDTLRRTRIDPPEALEQADRAKLLNVDRQSGWISFWKEAIEEILAARHVLVRFADGGCSECQLLWRPSDGAPGERALGEPPVYPPTAGAWEQTTILTAGLANSRDRFVSADAFVQAVLVVNPHLAGRCISEGGAAVSDDVRDEVRRTLQSVTENPAKPMRERVPCGVLLGRLGDPRFHGPELFCLPKDDLLGFVEIPAGRFVMGSDHETATHWGQEAAKDGYSSSLYDDEVRQANTQPMPRAYLIARYPVTNAQYRCFAMDDGYCNKTKEWRDAWTLEGWAWLKGERWSDALEKLWHNAYDFYREHGQAEGYDTYEAYRDQGVRPYLERLRKDHLDKDYWLDPENNAPNQPVMGVTWYEAVAYARWLGWKLLESSACPPRLRARLAAGWKIALPSEPEWEMAARGGLMIVQGGVEGLNPELARQWTWQGGFDPGRCNIAEGADPVKWLSPAGMFLNGASPYGCLDMIGNVWEWARSIYAPYPYPTDERERQERERLDGTDVRVLRGGSWVSNRRYARCPVRLRGDPDGTHDFIGLRLVVSLSASGF